jgi:serine/threonine-protein kinase
VDARLLDFGLCRLRDDVQGQALTRSAQLIGTAGFLAPEQVASTFGDVGPHTDAFALGCVVYEALSGQRAFPGRDAGTAAYEALHHHPTPIRELRPELPEGIDWVLTIALAKATGHRYGRAGEFARDLEAVVRGTPPRGLAARAVSLLRSRPPSAQTLTS